MLALLSDYMRVKQQYWVGVLTASGVIKSPRNPVMHNWLNLHPVLVTLVVLMRWWTQNHGKYLGFMLVKFYLSESGGRAHLCWSGSVMEVDQPLCGGLVQAPLQSSAGQLLQPAQAPPDHYITSHGADVQTYRKHLWTQSWAETWLYLSWSWGGNPPGKSNPDPSTTLTRVIRD